MKLRPNRIVERAAVNAARAFFEANGCVFQEVDGGNDYGKDAYVDLTFGGQVTGLCAALQIKGGESYRRAGGGYAIPLDADHAAIWRGSTIPIFGIVHDPSDSGLRWCNISRFLSSSEGGQLPGSIPVDDAALLTPMVLHGEFRVAVEDARVLRGDHAVMQVLSESETVSIWAIRDCLALGRTDARALIALRYLLGALGSARLINAIFVLSHATPHPDIFWHAGNCQGQCRREQSYSSSAYRDRGDVSMRAENPCVEPVRGFIGARSAVLKVIRRSEQICHGSLFGMASIGLVNVGVKLCPATKENGIAFNLLDRGTMKRPGGNPGVESRWF